MKCSLIILMMYPKTRAQDDPSTASSDSLFDSPVEVRMSLPLPFRLPSPAWCASLEDPAPGGVELKGQWQQQFINWTHERLRQGEKEKLEE